MLQTDTLDIPTLAVELTAVHAKLDLAQQRLALAIIRLLGDGETFGTRELAERTGIELDELASRLDRLPPVSRDEEGRVHAFSGLSLKPTPHAMEVDGRTLYAWCAFDSLFLPELLGRSARVRSTCPHTGTEITLTADPDDVHDVTPEGAVMTIRGLDGYDVQDVVGTFCCYVHFFESVTAARTWAKRSAGTHVITIDEGFELGRLRNQRRLGAALREVAGSPDREGSR